MNDPLAALPTWAFELLRGARVARFGMIDDEGAPRVLPVTFALHEGRVWTVVDAKPKRHPEAEPARVRFLTARPEVAVTVDTYSDDWSRLAWVQVLGRASVLELSEERGALAALSAKYPQYLLQAPPGPLIRIDPGRGLTWRAGEAGADEAT